MTRQVRARFYLLAGVMSAVVTVGAVHAQTPPSAPSPTPVTGAPGASPVPATPELPVAPGVSETPAAVSPATPFVETLPQTIDGVPGTWDLSRDGTTRRCVMTLTSQSSDSGRRLSFPAGCRRALPILNGIAGWLFTDGVVRLVDKNVRPVLLFTIRSDKRSLMAKTESGDVYSLVPLQIAAMAPPAPPGADGRAPSFQLGRDDPDAAATSTAETSATGERPTAGTYALDRYREQDVCRLALTPAEGATAPVRVLDGCRDSGLTTFDPVAWQAAPGRLTLVARKGHMVNLVPAGENHWRREPEVGTTFVLRRLDAGAAPRSP